MNHIHGYISLKQLFNAIIYSHSSPNNIFKNQKIRRAFQSSLEMWNRWQSTLTFLYQKKCYFGSFRYQNHLFTSPESFRFTLTQTTHMSKHKCKIMSLEVRDSAAGRWMSGGLHERLLSRCLYERRLSWRLYERLLSGRFIRRLLNKWWWTGWMAVQGPWLRMKAHRLRLIGHVGGGLSVVRVPLIRALVWRWGTTGEYASTNEQEGGRHPTDIKSLSELPSLGVDEQRVIEVLYDHVTRPGDGNDATEAGHENHASRHEEDHTLGSVIPLDARRALHAGDWDH